VVVDVLRATTTIVVALEAGAAEVIAVAGVEEARGVERARPGALLAGERRGVPPPGFVLGNSPREYTPGRVGGRTVVLSTTNGTRALGMLGGARATYVGALRNAAALVERLRDEAVDVTLIAAGRAEGQRVGLDDVFVLGLIADRLAGAGGSLDDGAQIALHLYRGLGGDARAAFAASAHGRFLISAGFAADLDLCAEADAARVVPVARVLGNGLVRITPE
jgi:2-phosphosulfolactate phosphatase